MQPKPVTKWDRLCLERLISTLRLGFQAGISQSLVRVNPDHLLSEVILIIIGLQAPTLNIVIYNKYLITGTCQMSQKYHHTLQEEDSVLTFL